MRLEIENQIFFFNLVNKGHKVDIFNKEISSIDFFCSRTERVKAFEHGIIVDIIHITHKYILYLNAILKSNSYPVAREGL